MRTIQIQSSSLDKAVHQIYESLEKETASRKTFNIVLKSVRVIVNSHEAFYYVFEIGE